MKKKLLIPVCIILAVILLIGSGIAYMTANSIGISVGRALSANGSYMMIRGNSPIQMSNMTNSEKLFTKLSDGDKILVLHDGIAESYPGKTGVYAVFKLSDGTLADISDDVLTQLTELGWQTDTKLNLPEVMPDDFSFALTWGTYGISSYDSKTGKLVKTTDATHPEDYITEYMLHEEHKAQIYDFIRALDVNSYPLMYDPYGDGRTSYPSATFILTVRTDTAIKTIKAEKLVSSIKSANEKGQAFLTTCRAIRDILTATEEWKALPEYEFFYD